MHKKYADMIEKSVRVLAEDAGKADEGNKAAARRFRTETTALTKLLKEARADSLAYSSRCEGTSRR